MSKFLLALHLAQQHSQTEGGGWVCRSCAFFGGGTRLFLTPLKVETRRTCGGNSNVSRCTRQGLYGASCQRTGVSIFSPSQCTRGASIGPHHTLLVPRPDAAPDGRAASRSTALDAADSTVNEAVAVGVKRISMVTASFTVESAATSAVDQDAARPSGAAAGLGTNNCCERKAI